MMMRPLAAAATTVRVAQTTEPSPPLTWTETDVLDESSSSRVWTMYSRWFNVDGNRRDSVAARASIPSVVALRPRAYIRCAGTADRARKYPTGTQPRSRCSRTLSLRSAFHASGRTMENGKHRRSNTAVVGSTPAGAGITRPFPTCLLLLRRVVTADLRLPQRTAANVSRTENKRSRGARPFRGTDVVSHTNTVQPRGVSWCCYRPENDGNVGFRSNIARLQGSPRPVLDVVAR